jgi:hypothetical protein
MAVYHSQANPKPHEFGPKAAGFVFGAIADLPGRFAGTAFNARIGLDIAAQNEIIRPGPRGR